jgi:uncharacterized protein YndB with AHSA1/START domain
VYRAWTDPEALTQWFAPTDEYRTKVTELDVRVGGRYRVEMHSPEGKIHCVTGTYREVRPPHKLVYTWAWEGQDMPETVVTVEFLDRGGSTEIALTHELFPTPEVRDEHAKGWTACLGRLVKAL